MADILSTTGALSITQPIIKIMLNPSALNETVQELQTIRISSLPLQILLYMNQYYILIRLNLFVMFQRFHSTPIELMSLFLLSLFDCFRIRLAVRGNRCEKAAPMAWASSLCCPIAIGYVFFLKTNTNILVHDKLLNAVPLSFIAAEFALSVLAIIVFQRKG